MQEGMGRELCGNSS